MTHINRVVTASGRDAKFAYRLKTIRGKKRLIAEPNTAMRFVHRRLIARLRRIGQNQPSLLASSFGALTGRSAMENAEAHAKGRFFYQLDIRNAYPSTPTEWVLAYVLNLLDGSLGDIEEIQQFLDRYCVAYKDGMPAGLAVGAPASPALFDLYCSDTIDKRIRELCPACVYTRYVDDLTISSARPIPGRLRKKIRDVVRAAGYEVHRNKSSLKDRSRGSVLVTGVVITRTGGLLPTRGFLEKTEEVLAIPSHELTRSHIAILRGLQGHLLSFGWNESHREVARLQRKVGDALRLARGQGEKTQRTTRFYSAKELDQIAANAPFTEIVELFLGELKRSGKEYIALCPYHHERTPSFTVSEEKGFYHCFGCGSHGDVFGFVMNHLSCSFPTAVEFVRSFETTSQNAPSP